MHLEEEKIQVFISETLNDTEKETIFNLWNSCYPSSLAFQDKAGLEKYLAGLQEAIHYFFQFKSFWAWSMVFKRDGEIWFALIVDEKIQNQGVGKFLLNFIKQEHPLLNGWVIDNNAYQTKSGRPYVSPLPFYAAAGFEIMNHSRLNLPHLTAVQVRFRGNKPAYLFQTKHMGCRVWQYADLEAMAAISADEEVMAFFPSIQNKAYVLDFIKRMKVEYKAKGLCYFAVDLLATNEMIGFIGLHEQTFASDFTPCIDIGWRLKKEVWNKGYATEGAKASLDYGFNHLHLNSIYSITPEVNLKSQRIMQKIGMRYVKTFEFELLKNDARLKKTVLYCIKKTDEKP